MKFNIVVVQPECNPSYIHNQCFIEVAHTLNYALKDLGHRVVFADRLQPDCYNLILGYQLLLGKSLPPAYSYIVYQLEQLANPAGWPGRIIDTLKSPCVVWDFSQKNVEILAKHGVPAIYKPLGFHPKMKRIARREHKDIDILFYGSMNHRRKKILTPLERKCRVKTLFGVYGRERDHWISRAKIVLHIHYYESKLFDEVRLSYLLNNGIFTLVETTPHQRYEEFLAYAKYDELVEMCEFYLERDELREEIAQKMLQGFQAYPETKYLETALAQM